VTVVNLVCEDSIEHQILHLLGAKQALADGVLDGEGNLATLKMPSGRGAMIERMQAMMAAEDRAAPRIVAPEETLADELAHRYGERALLVETRTGTDGRVRILAVLDVDGEALAAEAKRHQASSGVGPIVEVIDRPTWLAMRRLTAGGMITMAQGEPRVLHQSPELMAAGDPGSDAHARVLATGGFPEEALPLVAKAIGVGAAAKLAAMGELAAAATMATPAQMRHLVDRGALAPQAETALSALWSAAGASAVGNVASLIEMGALVIAGLDEGNIATAA
jgi:hypothetical protein